MGSRPAVSRESILEVAYDRAQRDGMASLGIRTIARECGVAIGTIYNYFPDKASLVTEVVERFWRNAIEEAGVLPGADSADQGERGSLVVYCRCLAEGLTRSLGRFKESWLREVSSLDSRSLARSREAEVACFHEIQQGIAIRIENDPGILPEVRDRFDTVVLAEFIWNALFGSIKMGDAECKTLLTLLELALYQHDAE